MATALTFSSLQVDMRRYLERGALVDTTVYEQLPRLINLAERAIAQEMKFQGFINVVVTTLVQGTSVYQKPDRWRATVSMNFGTGDDSNTRQPLFARSYEYARDYNPDSTTEALPLFYADYDYEHWLISPTPDANYPWEIIYYQQPPLLDDTNQTNWLTDYAPNALLYRALLEATPFLKNDDRIPVWQAMYGQSMQAINVQDLQKIVDRATTRKEP
jgi:hypothetical protein